MIRIPASFATAVRFPSDSQTGRPALEEESAVQPFLAHLGETAQIEPRANVEAARFSSIAVNCCDAEQIHQAISARTRRRPELSTPFVAPRSTLEEELAAIWSELLGVDQIGVDDNFLDLGGHSLSAMQLLSRIRETCKVELSLRSLFSDQFTIAILARMVIEQQIAAGNREDIEALLGEINALSDEEVRALLAESDLGADRSDK